MTWFEYIQRFKDFKFGPFRNSVSYKILVEDINGDKDFPKDVNLQGFLHEYVLCTKKCHKEWERTFLKLWREYRRDKKRKFTHCFMD